MCLGCFDIYKCYTFAWYRWFGPKLTPRDVDFPTVPSKFGTRLRHGGGNGFCRVEAEYSARSSIRRLCEHHMVPPEGCDGQYPLRSSSDGLDIGITCTARDAPETAEYSEVGAYRTLVHFRATICFWVFLVCPTPY